MAIRSSDTEVFIMKELEFWLVASLQVNPKAYHNI